MANRGNDLCCTFIKVSRAWATPIPSDRASNWVGLQGPTVLPIAVEMPPPGFPYGRVSDRDASCRRSLQLITALAQDMSAFPRPPDGGGYPTGCGLDAADLLDRRAVGAWGEALAARGAAGDLAAGDGGGSGRGPVPIPLPRRDLTRVGKRVAHVTVGTRHAASFTRLATRYAQAVVAGTSLP